MVVLQSTGEVPIEFEGELLHEFSNQLVNGRDRNRYYEIDIYSHGEGGFVCNLTWKTLWQGEQSICTVEDFDTIDDLIEWLKIWNPLQHLNGFPKMPQFQEKQIALENQITSDWKTLWGDICRKLGTKKQLRRGKPAHALGVCENPGWSIPEQIRTKISNQSKVFGIKPSELVTRILSSHYGLENADN